jgi:hypothetical protein
MTDSNVSTLSALGQALIQIGAALEAQAERLAIQAEHVPTPAPATIDPPFDPDTTQTEPAGVMPTYEETAAFVTTIARKKSRDEALAILAKFGAKKLPEIPAEKFADVIAACEEALA